MVVNVHNSIIHNSPKLKTIQISPHWQKDRQKGGVIGNTI